MYAAPLLAYVGLLLLLLISVTTSLLSLGPFNVVISLSCAFAQAGLVAAVFMNLRNALPMVRVFALAGLLWLSFMLVLTLADYLTR